MAAPTTPVVVVDTVRHFEFCLPAQGQVAPRLESFPYYEDDPKSGRSRVTNVITACLECGARHYQPKEN